MDSEKKKLDLTCKCGHSKKLHASCGPPIGEEWCNGRSNREIKIKQTPNNKKQYYRCDCPFYREDNLAHIERLAKLKGLI